MPARAVEEAAVVLELAFLLTALALGVPGLLGLRGCDAALPAALVGEVDFFTGEFFGIELEAGFVGVLLVVFEVTLPGGFGVELVVVDFRNGEDEVAVTELGKAYPVLGEADWLLAGDEDET